MNWKEEVSKFKAEMKPEVSVISGRAITFGFFGSVGGGKRCYRRLQQSNEMTRDEILRIWPNASESTIRANLGDNDQALPQAVRKSNRGCCNVRPSCPTVN